MASEISTNLHIKIISHPSDINLYVIIRKYCPITEDELKKLLL